MRLIQQKYELSLEIDIDSRCSPYFDDEDDADHEVVRATLADNPVPLLLPDHRVRDGFSAVPPKIEQRLRSLEGL
jgi:methylated-DNA-[protein]-cysteine S-methyltransferase